MNLQSAYNQALASAARMKFGKKIATELPSVRVKKDKELPLTDREIEEAQAHSEYLNAQSKAQGFKSGQAQADVQAEAAIEARKLKEQDPNFGFYVSKEKDVPKSAWEGADPAPGSQYIKGSLEKAEQEAQKSLNQKYLQKAKEKQNLEERKSIIIKPENLSITKKTYDLNNTNTDTSTPSPAPTTTKPKEDKK